MKNNPLYHLARLGLTEISPTNGTLEVLKSEGIALGEVIAQLSDGGGAVSPALQMIISVYRATRDCSPLYLLTLI